MEYEMSQAEGNAKGLLKWYNRQMKKQAGPPILTDQIAAPCQYKKILFGSKFSQII